MAKKIVLCFDGTWQDSNDNTNVIKIYRSILGEDRSRNQVDETDPPHCAPTIKWYDEGVGTKWRNMVPGGLFGRGLAKNILEGHKFLADNYDSGDEIYLFGFSRGAYTARSLAGMIRNIGLIRGCYTKEKEVECNPVLMNGFRLYQRRDGSADTEEAKFFRSKYSICNVEIRFLGVWDTVGSLGAPPRSLDWVDRGYDFHDTTLSRIVRNAYHALAIDETRPEFMPTLWTSAPKEGQTLEQVWFAGVHWEVGGGGECSTLADVPLQWMQEKAMANGLELHPEQVVRINEERYLRAKVSDNFVLSWCPLYLYPLWAGILCSKPHVRPIGGTPSERVHALVFQKREAHNSSYNPANQGLDSAEIDPGGCEEWDYDE